MIISNATPLIAFARINQLALLQKVVGKVIIPLGVAQEISIYTSGVSGSIDLAHESWIETISVQSENTVSLLLSTLDQGEAEVIALALEVGAEVVLMDELTGRKIAESLNLKVTGSVGLLIRAKQLGHISAIKPYIQAMRDAGIYFSDRFIQAVLQQFGEG